MTLDMLVRMAEQLRMHEGLREQAYRDTLGNWTVGVGYNLTARGVVPWRKLCGRAFPHDVASVVVSRDEAARMLVVDITRIEAVVRKTWPYFGQLDEVRQRVALDLAFNIGHRAEGFKKAIAAIERKDWNAAAAELLNAKWAYQVDDGPGGKFGRADRLARMLRTGKDYVA